jgi:hypothetical protein
MWRIYNDVRFCRFCWKEFKTFKQSNTRWCSRDCYWNELRSVRPEAKCNICWKIFSLTKYRWNKHWKKYCCRNCYNNRRKESRMKIKRNTLYMRKFVESWCIDCWEKKYYLLQVHHKDWNSKNNIDSNLEVVCANCHIKRHLWWKNWRYIYWPKYYLTDRTLLSNL